MHLFLFVKVREWGNHPERYREMGLEFPSSTISGCSVPVSVAATP